MPTNTVLGRIDRVDFFAVLPAGFYVFIVAWVALLSYFPFDVQATRDWPLLVQHMEVFLRVVNASPASLLLILFGMFLFGSLIRSIPVQKIESCIPEWKDGGLRFIGKQVYPYRDTLKEIVSELEQQAQFLDLQKKYLPALRTVVTQSAFNHFKDLLCASNSSAFSHYQTFESRSRFFAGMFVAGVLGMLGGLIVMSNDLGAGIQLVVFSIVLVGTFGSSLRRVRRQEAASLLSFIIVLRQTQTLQKRSQ